MTTPLKPSRRPEHQRPSHRRPGQDRDQHGGPAATPDNRITDASPPLPRPRPPSQHAEAQSWLVITHGPQAGTRYPLGTARTILGRHRECDVIVDDTTVSLRHARIDHRDEQFVLVDQASLNGTYLNRKPLQAPIVLADGDEIQVGHRRLVFHLPTATRIP